LCTNLGVPAPHVAASATVPPLGAPAPRLLRRVAACASLIRRGNDGSFRDPDSRKRAVAARGTAVAGMTGEVGGGAATRLDRDGEKINVRLFLRK
jgi:hypothetical protein